MGLTTEEMKTSHHPMWEQVGILPHLRLYRRLHHRLRRCLHYRLHRHLLQQGTST